MDIVNKLVEKYINNNYLTIDKLSSDVILHISDKDMIEMVKILIIDDDKLEIEDQLRRIGYNVYWKKDIDNLSDVEKYQIIICDYKGVGLKFANEFEGLDLMRLIKEKYPEKIVYLLSAANLSLRANEYFKYADEMVYKGEEHKLLEYINQDLCKIFNPRDSWIKYKTLLLKKGIKEIDIIKLENLYVRSMNNGKDYLSKDPLFLRINANLKVNFDVKVGLINL